ncbi:MAG: GNAT family N-acetyltransferase [Candidatus Dojkabacteria bacterium]
MKYKIIPYEEKYEDDIVELFLDSYHEPGYEWDYGVAKKYLRHNFEDYPDYNFVAVDDNGDHIGSVVCSVKHYYKGKVLFVESLQVMEEYRGKGVGKKLLSEVVQLAKKDGLTHIQFLADGGRDFPRKWYEDLGFLPTNWIEYEANINDIKL